MQSSMSQPSHSALHFSVFLFLWSSELAHLISQTPHRFSVLKNLRLGTTGLGFFFLGKFPIVECGFFKTLYPLFFRRNIEMFSINSESFQILFLHLLRHHDDSVLLPYLCFVVCSIYFISIFPS